MTPDPHKALREHLRYLLRAAVPTSTSTRRWADIPVDLRGRTVPPVPHSPWRLLEHMRIAQRDILEFSRKPEARLATLSGRLWPGAI
jgi:hypothetical protein